MRVYDADVPRSVLALDALVTQVRGFTSLHFSGFTSTKIKILTPDEVNG
jgi:hypothetical protein